MNIVLPLSPYTQNNFLELRYALRSLEMFTDKPRVILVGHKPDWTRNVTHVPRVDRTETQWKERNIFDKLILGASTIKGDFLYTNDDFFLLKPWDEKYYHSGSIEMKLYHCPRGSVYRNTVANTMRVTHHGKNYDCHCPITMHTDYLKVYDKIDWAKPYGYMIMTLYAELNRIKGTEYPDLKIKHDIDIRAAIKGRDWFSMADEMMTGEMETVLKELYPKKSKFEI